MRTMTIDELASAADGLPTLSEEMALTSGGKVIALVFPVDEDGLDEALRALNDVRFKRAVSALRSQAHASGADRLGQADIAGEIRAARGERHLG